MKFWHLEHSDNPCRKAVRSEPVQHAHSFEPLWKSTLYFKKCYSIRFHHLILTILVGRHSLLKKNQENIKTRTVPLDTSLEIFGNVLQWLGLNTAHLHCVPDNNKYKLKLYTILTSKSRGYRGINLWPRAGTLERFRWEPGACQTESPSSTTMTRATGGAWHVHSEARTLLEESRCGSVGSVSCFHTMPVFSFPLTLQAGSAPKWKIRQGWTANVHLKYSLNLIRLTLKTEPITGWTPALVFTVNCHKLLPESWIRAVWFLGLSVPLLLLLRC